MFRNTFLPRCSLQRTLNRLLELPHPSQRTFTRAPGLVKCRLSIEPVVLNRARLYGTKTTSRITTPGPKPGGSGLPTGPSSWKNFKAGYQSRWELRALVHAFIIFQISVGLHAWLHSELNPLTARRQVLALEYSRLTGRTIERPEAIHAGSEVLPSDHWHVQRLRMVMDRLAYAAGLETVKWKLVVLDDDSRATVNLGQTNTVTVTTGLLQAAESDSALAFVLGREVGGYLAHYGREQRKRQGFQVYTVGYVPMLAVLLGLVAVARHPNALASAGTILLPLSGLKSNSGLRHTQGEEADWMGLLLMMSAGYDARDAPQVMEIVCAQQGRDITWDEACFAWFYDRVLLPSVEQRRRRLESYIPAARQVLARCNDSAATTVARPPKGFERWAHAWCSFVKERETRRGGDKK